MRLGLLSDVHSNLQALEAVLEDVDGAGVDLLAFLGDAVGYNANPRECAQLLAQRTDVRVRGNHDEAVLQGGEEWFNLSARAGVTHSRKVLTQDELDWLQTMPLQEQVDGIHLVHGSPRSPLSEYVFPDTHPEALEAIIRHPSIGEARVVAMGHTHVPFVRQLEELVAVNVGSVGQPRDGDPRACWCVIETDELSVEHRRVAYDIDGAAQAVRDAGLPEALASRLYEGH